MKKRNRIILTMLPIGCSIIGLASFFLYQMTRSSEISNVTTTKSGNIVNEKNNIYTKYEIFPNLKSENYYKLLKIQNGDAKIDDDFIGKVVHDVINDVEIYDGEIEWEYDITDNRDQLWITFKWMNNGKQQAPVKTYYFNVSKVV